MCGAGIGQDGTMDKEQVLTTTEVARVLGVATSTVQLWMESGAIPSWKTGGGHRRTRYVDLLAVMERLGRNAGGVARTSLEGDFVLADQERFPQASDEQERLHAVDQSGLVGSPPEERFDRIVRLAARVADAPIALLTLLTARRQWFKARFGMAIQETPREWAFCSHAILGDGVFVVEDALSDPRFADNPLVTQAPHARFYSGIPLRDAQGRAFGTLCVIDVEPRKLRRAEYEALSDLAAIATAELQRGQGA